MKPYYDDGNGIQIYHGDSLEILPTVTADVAVTDPPFGISDSPLVTTHARTGKRTGYSGTYHDHSDWDKSISPEWGRLLSSCCKIIAWFGHWRKREYVSASISHQIRAEIVWAKDCHVGPPCPLAMRDERIWIFSAEGIKPRSFETTVWEEAIIPTWAHRSHKNEKPLKLMQRLLQWLPDGNILDPFMGSGTTLLAAKQLGRSAIGIDIVEKHCETAVRRLSQQILDFSPKPKRDPEQASILDRLAKEAP